MPVVAVFAFINREFWGAVVVLGDPRGELGFFFCSVADFMRIAYPTALGLVNLIRVEVIFAICHSYNYSTKS